MKSLRAWVGMLAGLAVVAAMSVGMVLTPSTVLAHPLADPPAGTWVTSFQVMNLETTTAALNVDYYRENGQKVAGAEGTYSVAPGSSVNVYQPSVAGLPDAFKGSVVVSSDKMVAAVGSENITYQNGSIGNSQYSGYGSADIGTTFYLPNINKRFGGSGWSTRITIQNATGSANTATIKFYNGDGTERSSAQQVISIAANGSATRDQIDNGNLPNGWLGSAIVTTTGDAAVIVDIRSNDGRLETYNGFGSGSTTMYLPTLLRGFGMSSWTTSYQVMNVGSSNAQIQIKYYTSGNPTPIRTTNATLAPRNSLNKHQENDDKGFLPNGWIGSAVITSNQPIVAVGTQSSYAPGKQLASAFSGMGTGAKSVVLPTVLRNFGASNWLTSFQIMNVGAAAASVTVEYLTPGNPTPVKTVRYNGTAGNRPKIAPNTSVNLWQGDDTSLGNGWQGSVRITSDQNVVVIGSQAGTRAGDAAGQYNGILVPAS